VYGNPSGVAAVRATAILLLVQAFSSAQNPQTAQALESRGDWPAAEAQWRVLTQAHPEDYRYWTSLGISLAHQRKYPEAIAAYRKSLSLHPDAAVAEFNLGVACFKSGRIEDAIPPLKKAAAQLPQSQQVDVVLGMSLYGVGKYSEAVPYLERAQARDAENKELRFVLAQSYLWAADYEKARSQFQSMLERDPQSAQVHMLLGEAYDALGRSDDAIAEFRAAVARGPIPDSRFGLGYLLWKSRKYPEAAAAFKDELRDSSGDSKTLAYLGDAELQMQQSGAARTHLTKAVALGDSIWIARFDLGKMDEQDRRVEAAVQNYQRAAALDPDRPEPHYRLAQLYRAAGDETHARAEFVLVQHLHAHKLNDLILKVTGKPVAATLRTH
jgi:tetratricopeptide (TPR) repeat protein